MVQRTDGPTFIKRCKDTKVSQSGFTHNHILSKEYHVYLSILSHSLPFSSCLRLPVYLSLSVSPRLSVPVGVHLSDCLSLCLSVSLSVSLSFLLSFPFSVFTFCVLASLYEGLSFRQSVRRSVRDAFVKNKGNQYFRANKCQRRFTKLTRCIIASL